MPFPESQGEEGGGGTVRLEQDSLPPESTLATTVLILGETIPLFAITVLTLDLLMEGSEGGQQQGLAGSHPHDSGQKEAEDPASQILFCSRVCCHWLCGPGQVMALLQTKMSHT